MYIYTYLKLSSIWLWPETCRIAASIAACPSAIMSAAMLAAEPGLKSRNPQRFQLMKGLKNLLQSITIHGKKLRFSNYRWKCIAKNGT